LQTPLAQSFPTLHALAVSHLAQSPPQSTSVSLAFFVPKGIGVQEGALVALLAHAAGLL